MTRASIREDSEAVRWRYLQTSKKEKTKVLDEFTKVTGYHHKAIIRLLHRVNQPNDNRKRGRLRQYSATVVGALAGFGRTPCPSTKEDQPIRFR